MKCIIAGGRKYQTSAWDEWVLDLIWKQYGITEVVSGGAPGADRCGEDWAKSRGIALTTKPANWQRYGRGAGPIRNREMADYADAVILFPGGRGTDNMYETAKKKGLLIIDFRDGVPGNGETCDKESSSEESGS